MSNRESAGLAKAEESVDHHQTAVKALENDEPASIPRPDVRAPEFYLNRELTWLAFNRRVLAEAEDERNPLLER
ncbi:MAG: hypothetical protein ACREQX_01565, partial [Candidatus Binataceae bacterium]